MRCGISMHIKPEFNSWGDFLYREYITFFGRQGLELVCLPNACEDIGACMRRMRLDGLILSGGNDVHADPSDKAALLASRVRNSQERKLLSCAIREKLPVFGICRGMQFINHYFKGSLVTGIPRHVREVHALKIRDISLVLMTGKEKFSVNSFHRQAVRVDEVSPALSIAAESPDGYVEALFHKKLPIFAVQWHPERAGGDTSANKAIAKAFRDRLFYWRKHR